MATSWKSQQSNGEYALQFETDDKEKYKLVEKAAQMAVDGKTTANFVEVVRCKDCAAPHNKWTGCPNLNGLIPPPDFYCAKGERKEQK